MRVLFIEDDREISSTVKTMLERRRFAVDIAADGEEGLDYLLRGSYDLAIVDVVLPKRDGFAICRTARSEGIQTPLLILTARDAVEDRIRGLDCGADDYLIKPFAEEELAARIRALLRRGDRPVLPEELRIGNLTIDPSGRGAAVGATALRLGATEFRMLEYFGRNHGTTLSRAQILERIWDYDFDGTSNIVDVYVGQLRRKLKACGATATIQTVWGTGYKLVNGDSKTKSSSG